MPSTWASTSRTRWHAGEYEVQAKVLVLREEAGQMIGTRPMRLNIISTQWAQQGVAAAGAASLDSLMREYGGATVLQLRLSMAGV
jgi:hypothetical protein